MLLLLSAATLLLADPTPVAAAKPARAGPAGEKLVCKSFEITGSRMGRDRVCKTADEWRMEEDMRDKQVDDAQRAAATQR